MVKKIMLIGVVLCLLSSCLFVVHAEEFEQRANEYFNSASTTLFANKSVEFYCLTTTPANQIRVSYCWLQQKVEGKWEFVKHLTPPSHTVSGSAFFTVTVSYAGEIGSGTYRVAATYNADGHAIAAYSGEKTF